VLITAVALAGAVVIGAMGVATVGIVLVPFIVAGPLLVVAYNAELFGGIVHTDAGFAAAWGAFPVLTAYVAQMSTLRPAAAIAGAGAFALSWAQRALSTPARLVRRSVRDVEGTMTMADGTVRDIDARTVLAPLERALRAMSWGLVTLSAGLAVARLT
jgi:hypothetical protein